MDATAGPWASLLQTTRQIRDAYRRRNGFESEVYRYHLLKHALSIVYDRHTLSLVIGLRQEREVLNRAAHSLSVGQLHALTVRAMEDGDYCYEALQMCCDALLFV